MTLQENVEKAIRHGRSVIAKHGYDLNETITRYAIMDPILVALGWKLDDPDRCKFEERKAREGQEARGQTDYTLYKNGELAVVIEAKSLSSTLNGFSEENQLAAYKVDPKKWVLTNGRRWYFYDTRKKFGNDVPPDVDLSPGTDSVENAKILIKNLSSRKRW